MFGRDEHSNAIQMHERDRHIINIMCIVYIPDAHVCLWIEFFVLRIFICFYYGSPSYRV